MGAVLVWEEERVLEMHNGDGVTAMHICLMALNCALKHGRSGLCYVMLSVIYHNFAVGQWSLPGPGTDGRDGVRPGWRAGGMAPDRRGGAEVPAGPFPGWLCLGTAGCPHVLRCSLAWRWLLRNVNKSLKINILLNFSHSRLFVQLFFFFPQAVPPSKSWENKHIYFFIDLVSLGRCEPFA